MVVWLAQEPGSLNPVISNDAVSSDLARLTYRSLLDVDPRTGALLPGLAESYEFAADGRTLTFRLRDALRWSDGTPLSGGDFSFTVESVMRSEKSVRRGLFVDIVGAKDFADRRASTIAGITVDGRTITVRFERAFCPAAANIGTFFVLPRHVFGKYADPKAFDTAPENTLPPIASGPYRLRERQPGRLIYERNDGFYAGPALLDEVEFRVTPQAEVKSVLLAGGVDVAVFAPVEPALRDDLRRSGLVVRSFLGQRYTYIGWNQLRAGKEFFRSKAVRQALAYGLDVDAVLDKALSGEAIKMLAHTHPLSWAYDPTGLNEYRYAPARAEELLQQDGWRRGADGVYAKAGQRLAFTITTFAALDNETLLREAVDQYRKIGVEATGSVEPGTTFFARLAERNDPVYGAEGGISMDAYIVRWVLGPDPDAFSIWHSSEIVRGNNLVGYRNAVVDQALEDGRMKCSRDDRRAAYRAMDRQLNEDQPYRFVLAPNSLFVASQRLRGADPGPFGGSFGHLWNIDRWWVAR